MHLRESGTHAHAHRHPGGAGHSHVHAHKDGPAMDEAASGPPYLLPRSIFDNITAGPPPRHGHRAVLLTDDDDEVGVLVTDGVLPDEAKGRHCRYCGEGIGVLLGVHPAAPGAYVLEYHHSLTRTVHCAQEWQGGNLIGLADETASPCWRPNCLSNAEREAKKAGGGR